MKYTGSYILGGCFGSWGRVAQWWRKGLSKDGKEDTILKEIIYDNAIVHLCKITFLLVHKKLEMF